MLIRVNKWRLWEAKTHFGQHYDRTQLFQASHHANNFAHSLPKATRNLLEASYSVLQIKISHNQDSESRYLRLALL